MKLKVLIVIISLLLLGGCSQNESNEALGYKFDNEDIHIISSGTTLKDMQIEGNLYIDETVGEGEFYVENVQVDGDIVVHGGGPHSGYFVNVVGKRLLIESKTDPKIVLDVDTSLEGVQLASDCRLHVEGAQVKAVTVNHNETENAINVLMTGELPDVTLESAANVKIDGSVNLLSVLKGAGLSSINMVDTSKVYFYSCYGQSVTVTGGTIVEAWINAEYCSLPKNTETINSEVGIAEVTVGEVDYQIPSHDTARGDIDDDDQESNETSTDETEDDEDKGPVLESGYPRVNISFPMVSITVYANRECKVHTLVETLEVYNMGTTPENVRDGISAGADMSMGDGSYIVIANSFTVSSVDREQTFWINMEDYLSKESPDDATFEDEGTPEEGGSNGVFVVIEDEQGNLSKVYGFN